MAITAGAPITAGAGANDGTAICSKPTGLATGDFMVAVVTFSNNGFADNVPAGWTTQTQLIHSTLNITHATYTKFATASEPASYTWSRNSATGQWTVVIIAFTGVDATTPVEASDFTEEAAASDVTILHPALTTSTANDMLVSALSHHGATTAGITYTWPDGTWTGTSVQPSTSAKRNSGLGYKQLSATNPAAFDVTASTAGIHIGSSLALKTAVAGGDTTPPSNVSGLGASVSGGTVTLTWSAATDDTAVTNYDIYRGSTSGGEPAAGSPTASVGNVLTTTDAPGNGTWYYTVRARDAAGNRSVSNSNEASATVTIETLRPDAILENTEPSETPAGRSNAALLTDLQRDVP